MRPRKKVRAPKRRTAEKAGKAKKCCNIKKRKCNLQGCCLVAILVIVISLAALGTTGQHPVIAGFFDFGGLIKTQAAFAEYNGQMMRAFTDDVIAAADEGLSALGVIHGKFVAMLTIKPLKNIPTPIDIAAGIFKEMGSEAAGFGGGFASDLKIAFNDVGGALELAFNDLDYKADAALYYSVNGVRAVGRGLLSAYPEALARQFE